MVDLGSDGHVAHSSCEVEPGGGRFVTTKGNDLVVVDLETNLVESRFSLAEPPFNNVGAFGFTGRQAGGCSVGVEDLIEQLRETTDALLGPLHRRIGRSLDAKIQAAGASWVRCQPDTACHQLDAFRNEVAAMERSGRLDSVDAAALDLGAALVQGALSECPCLGGPGDRR